MINVRTRFPKDSSFKNYVNKCSFLWNIKSHNLTFHAQTGIRYKYYPQALECNIGSWSLKQHCQEICDLEHSPSALSQELRVVKVLRSRITIKR